MSVLRKVVTATIPSGQSLSNGVFLGAGRIVAIEMPAAWDAAGLSFQFCSDNNQTYRDAYASGSEVTETVAASRVITGLTSSRYDPALWIKVRSGTAGTPVAQTADRTLRLITVPLTR